MKARIVLVFAVVALSAVGISYSVYAAKKLSNPKSAGHSSQSIKEKNKSQVVLRTAGDIPKHTSKSDIVGVSANGRSVKDIPHQIGGKTDGLELCFSNHGGVLEQAGLVRAGRARAQLDSIKKGLRNADAQGERKAVLAEARKAGKLRLMAVREAFRKTSAKSTVDVERYVAKTKRKAAHRTTLSPLSSAQPGNRAVAKVSKQLQAAERLTESLSKADNPVERDRLRLRLASAYVGWGDWDQARSIYRELADNAVQKQARQTALRNLNILGDGQPDNAQSCDECPKPGNGGNSGKGGVK